MATQVVLGSTTQYLSCTHKKRNIEDYQRLTAPRGAPVLWLLYVLTVLRCSRCTKGGSGGTLPALGIILGIALGSHAPLASAEQSLPVLSGTVIKIVDGDTLDVQISSGSIRVRLHGVDTPERGQPWAKEATAALTTLVQGEQVEVEPFEQDRYDRMIGIVFLGELNVNLELVKRGHAWAYRRYMRKFDSELCINEAAARTTKRGLWALPIDERVAPWEWRRKKSLPALTDYSKETAASCIAAIGKS